jgi:outer membrane protein assembly factor BamB
MVRLRNALLAGLVVPVLGTLAACGPREQQTSPTPSTTPSPVPSVAPSSSVALPIGDTPLWTQEVGRGIAVTPGAIGSLARFQLFGAVVVLGGLSPGPDATNRLAVVDAATGALRWVVNDDEPAGGGTTFDFVFGVRLVGDPAGDWTAITQYKRALGNDRYEFGLVGVSGQNGKPRWRIPVNQGTRCSCPWTRAEQFFLGPADASTVTVEILISTPQTDESTRTVAYDIATGRQLWSSAGVRPRAIDNDLLLVERPALPAPTLTTPPPPAQLSALDLRTGAPRWDLTAAHPTSALNYVAGDTLLVDADGSTLVVDALTGRELGSYGHGLTSCSGIMPLVVCRDGGADIADDKAVSLRRAGDAVSVERIPYSQPCWRVRFWQGVLFCDDSTQQGPKTTLALDPGGAVVATHLPGRLEAVNASFAVFSTGQVEAGEGSVRIYAVHSP